MASRSPTPSTRARLGREGRYRYLQGWATLARAIDAGLSWSGNERNCAFLNLGDGTFADVSSASGLDFPGDGRAVASLDWDGDLDLDLLLKNRTGPQLRVMRNDLGGEALAFELQGTRSNRDAVGARVLLTTERGTRMREVACGAGYLSQSSRRLVFGLRGAGKITGARVRWPDGTVQDLGVPVAGRLHRVVEGRPGTVAREPRRVPLEAGTLERPVAPATNRLLLREALPLPPSLQKAIWGSRPPNRPVLLNLWAQWCAPCITELADQAAHASELDAAGFDVLAINVDEPADRGRAAALWKQRIAPRIAGGAFLRRDLGAGGVRTLQVLVGAILSRPGELTLPTSLFVDSGGRIQMLYQGGVARARLVADFGRYVRAPVLGALRSTRPGRWYFRTPRDLQSLARALREAGRPEAAHFYSKLDRARR